MRASFTDRLRSEIKLISGMDLKKKEGITLVDDGTSNSGDKYFRCNALRKLVVRGLYHSHQLQASTNGLASTPDLLDNLIFKCWRPPRRAFCLYVAISPEDHAEEINIIRKILPRIRLKGSCFQIVV
jgi:hypothetical protein